MSGINSGNKPFTGLTPKSGTRKSPPKSALGKNSSPQNSNEKDPQRKPAKSGTRKSQPKKLKPRHPAINITKQQFERFRQQFEELFAYMDYEQEYEVSETMIELYIANRRNNLSSPAKIRSAAEKLFKSHRYLLYLDQFIAFVNEFSGETKFLSSFTSNDYFDLPIAARVIPKLAAASNNRNLAQEYSAEVYRELQPINDMYQRASRNMRDISLITCHGEIKQYATFLVVPDDVIIAFPTPLNKFQSNSFTNQIFFDILEPYRTNPEFLANPACYFRGDDCLMNTIYYYPGQLIPNFEFSYDISVEWENADLGFYPNNPDENMRDELFNKDTDTKYSTNIYYLFRDKQKLLKNKITYINCCRRCDSDIPNINIEFLYRYEHILTYLNLSNCVSIDTEMNNGKCDYDITFRKHSFKYNKLAENYSGHPYFYDPTLLSTFKTGNIHKDWYLSEKPEKYIKTIEELNKITSPTLQLEKFDEIFRSLIQKLKDNPELYAQRIIDLFDKVEVKFSLFTYIQDHNIINVLFDYFNKYGQSDKVSLIYNIMKLK